MKSLLKYGAVALVAFVLGWGGRDQRWRYWHPVEFAEVIVGQQRDGTPSLQINVGGEPTAWIALTPGPNGSIAYIRGKLENLP